MYKECQTPNSRKRQKYIAHVLVEMMGEMSFQEVQISALCRRAEIPRKAFYRYFDTKEDVISYLAETALAEGSAEKLSIWGEEIREGEAVSVGEHVFRYWKERPELFNALTDQVSLGIFQTAFMRMVLERQLGLDRVNEAHESARAVAIFSAIGFMGLLMPWHRTGFQRTPEEMGRMYARMLRQPLYR